MKYKGTVVEESLVDNRFINNLNIESVRITAADRPEDRWHLYDVVLDEGRIAELAKQLKPEKWYAHFWNGNEVVAVFPDIIFRFQYSDKSSWREAIAYGRSIGIPEEQLDFPIA